MKTVVFTANDVIDFTWTASPHFIERRSIQGCGFHILTYEIMKLAKRYFKIIKNAFAYLDEHVGKYPYPTLTLIDPPFMVFLPVEWSILLLLLQ